MSRAIRSIVLVVAAAAIAAVFVSASGLSPYPVTAVGLFGLAVACEAAALLLILGSNRPRVLWGRALLAALLGIVALWFSAQDTLGAPRYVFMHQRWLVAVIVGCLGLAVANGLSGWRARRRAVAARP